MNVLVLDTSTDAAAVAVKIDDNMIVSANVDPSRRHGRDLVPRLREALQRAGLRPLNLDLIAVGLGPGSYTGLRIGLAAAKTLAYVTGSAILGIDSLEAISANAPSDAESVSIIADAQRGELYTADFSRSQPGEPLRRMTPTRIEPFAAWSSRIAPGTLVLGPGVDSPRIRPSLPEWIKIGDAKLNGPVGEGLVEIAIRDWSQGKRDDLRKIEPHYLRRSAAEEQWETKPASRPRSQQVTTPSADQPSIS